MRTSLLFNSALLASLLLAASAQAQDTDAGRIRLAEVLPALAGTELGAVDLGPAPAPGGTRVLRDHDVTDAIARAGRDSRGLAIPHRMRVHRAAAAGTTRVAHRRLERDDLDALVRDAIERAAPGCSVASLALPDHLTLDANDVDATAELTVPRTQSATVVAAVTLRTPTSATRLPTPARLTCAPPDVTPGASVTIVALVGHVRATAAGVSTQPGRVGDTVRVTATATHTTLEARVVDAHTVEVRR